MQTWRAEATAASERLAAPLSDTKDRLTKAVGEAQERVSAGRDRAFSAIAEKPLRSALITFVAGLIAGLIAGAALAQLRSSRNRQWR